MTVLIIEDVVAVAELWRQFLAEIFIVRVAHDWQAGYALMRVRPAPDIVLLDLVLPDSRDPKKTLERIQTLKSINPNCAVIAITGNNDDSLAKFAAMVGADFFALKQEYGDSQRKLLDAIHRGLRGTLDKGTPAYQQNLAMLDVVTDIITSKTDEKIQSQSALVSPFYVPPSG